MPAKIVVSRRVASAKCNLYLCRFMKDVVYNIKDRIIAIIDLFYPHFSKLMDLGMLVLPGGVERTKREYYTLLAEAGLRLDRIIPTKTSLSILEAVKA